MCIDPCQSCTDAPGDDSFVHAETQRTPNRGRGQSSLAVSNSLDRFEKRRWRLAHVEVPVCYRKGGPRRAVTRHDPAMTPTKPRSAFATAGAQKERSQGDRHRDTRSDGIADRGDRGGSRGSRGKGRGGTHDRHRGDDRVRAAFPDDGTAALGSSSAPPVGSAGAGGTESTCFDVAAAHAFLQSRVKAIHNCPPLLKGNAAPSGWSGPGPCLKTDFTQLLANSMESLKAKPAKRSVM